MTWTGFLQIGIYCALIALLAVPVGAYMTHVFGGGRTWLSPLMRPLEKLIYRICRIKENEDQHWLTYATSMLIFNGIGALFVYVLQRAQGWLPLNPQGMAAVPPDLSFNTAISFV
ncbi:MAG: potassium-transporting ATPase subunit KdpA, partial [SAR324 cluster bacterium]